MMTYVDVIIVSDKFGPWAYRTNVDADNKSKSDIVKLLKEALSESVDNAGKHLRELERECHDTKR